MPKVHKIALAWTAEKAAKNVLETWRKLDERDEVLASRTKDCAGKEPKELSQLNELIVLIRTDLRENYNFDALATAERQREERLLAKRRANCDLEEWRQKLVFQTFVRLEDIYGLSGRQRVINEAAKQYEISADCVERIARNATIDHPEWVPEPL